MDLITVILVLALIGLLVWAITTYVPMPAAIRTLIIAVVVICIVLWLLRIFGFYTIHVGR